MFKKINENEYILFIKKLWNNKRYRSLLVLGLYFIFFFIIIIGLRSNYRSIEDTESNNTSFSFEMIKESYNNLRDYSYEIFVNDESLINGKLENGINNFTYVNEQYTIINNTLYKSKNDDLKKVNIKDDEIVLSIIDKIMLNNLVDYIYNLNQNGIINDNSFKLDFEIPSNYFGLEIEKIINVSILGESKNKIDKVIVDLSNYKNENYVITMKVGSIDVSNNR